MRLADLPPGTDVRTELLAGLTTFAAMAYIVFVQPAILSGAMFGISTGMDFGAVTTATCLSAAIASAVMGLYARYPIAQAPGMGENVFFVLTAIPAAAAAGFAQPWRVALGMVFLSGVLFLVLSVVGVRERILGVLSPSFRAAVAAGIGLFIAFLGLQNGGLIVKDPATAVRLAPDLASPDIAVFLCGLLVAAGLLARRVRGALLWGIASALLLSIGLRGAAAGGWLDLSGSGLLGRFRIAHALLSTPPSLAPTFLALDVRGALTPALLPLVLVFLFMVLFDTVGTLVAVGQRAGLVRDGKLLRARQALTADATGTTVGALLGTSTVTSYIESAAGVEQGGRTGLTALTVAGLFLVAPIFSPVVAMVGSYPPITAPALVLVGALMMSSVREVRWDDASEALPAFIVLVGIPLTSSIADGLALGFVLQPVVMALAGRARQVPWLSWLLAVLLIAYYVTVREVLLAG